MVRCHHSAWAADSVGAHIHAAAPPALLLWQITRRGGPTPEIQQVLKEELGAWNLGSQSCVFLYGDCLIPVGKLGENVLHFLWGTGLLIYSPHCVIIRVFCVLVTEVAGSGSSQGQQVNCRQRVMKMRTAEPSELYDPLMKWRLSIDEAAYESKCQRMSWYNLLVLERLLSSLSHAARSR